MPRLKPSGSTTRTAPTSRRIAYRDAQAKDDPSTDIYAQPNRRALLGTDKLPTNQGVLVGSYASVARMLDELSQVPGVRGVMLTFDDFVIGMEQFGTRIMPLMRCLDKTKQGRVMGGDGDQDGRHRLHRGRNRKASGPGCRSGRGAGAGRAASPPDEAAGLGGVVAADLPADGRSWSCMFALPTALFLVVSFFDYDRTGIYPAFLLDSYREIFTSSSTLRVYTSTLKFALIVWAITLFLGFNIAYFLIFHVRSATIRTVFFLLCAIPFFTSAIIRTIAWIPFLGRTGAFNQAVMGLGLTSRPLDFLLFSDFAVVIAYVHLYTLLMVAPDRQLAVQDRPVAARGRARCRRQPLADDDQRRHSAEQDRASRSARSWWSRR